MSKRRGMIWGVIFVLALFFIDSSFAQDDPWYIKEWKEFARRANDPVLVKCIEDISTPNALRLGEEWKNFLGYTAPDLVKNNDPAPEIKPGMVINKENYQDYPGFKKKRFE